jgi:hypothetical protein
MSIIDDQKSASSSRVPCALKQFGFGRSILPEPPLKYEYLHFALCDASISSHASINIVNYEFHFGTSMDQNPQLLCAMTYFPQEGGLGLRRCLN